MSNPYQSPDDFSHTPVHLPSATGNSSTIVKVKVLAILMIVQGALEALLGLMLAGVGVFFYFAGQQMFAAQQRAGGGPPPPAWIFLIYLPVGLVLLAVAGIRIYAGIRNLSFKGRTLGIIAISCGLATSLTMYCAPTSIGLMIYGLIVYLDGNVAQAFKDVEAGLPPPR